MAAMIATAGLSPCNASVNGPELKKPAPPLNLSKVLQAPADASTNLEAMRGKVIVIDFWATWCGPCKKSIPHWNDLVDTFKGKPVQFLALTDENEQVVTEFLKRTPIHSWVGLDGVGQSMRDRYRIEGIPTSVIVNQKGVVVAVTHPASLQSKHIEEVILTGTSSLPPPAERVAGTASEGDDVERVPANKPAFEVSVQRSGPVPRGHGVDCWESSATSPDVSGQYASLRQAILTCFDGKQPLLECRTALPTEQYDFIVRLPSGASQADREQAEREVYVLTVASTNAPGLTPSAPDARGGGGEQRGGLQLGRATIDWLPGYLEKWLGKPVANETGLTNRYDIRLKWEMSKRELLPGAMDGPDPEAIRTAVREQLGLALLLQRRAMPVLIVEKAETLH